VRIIHHSLNGVLAKKFRKRLIKQRLKSEAIIEAQVLIIQLNLGSCCSLKNRIEQFVWVLVNRRKKQLAVLEVNN